MSRAPGAWRDLALAQRRGVVRDARRGRPLRPDVANAAGDWARWALGRSRRLIAVVGVFCIAVLTASFFQPRALAALLGVPAILFGAWVERRDARRVLAAAVAATASPNGEATGGT